MPKGKKLSPREKDDIIQIAADLKAQDPDITQKQIAEITGIDDSTVSKTLSDKRFERYIRDSKKTVDQIRYETLKLTDRLIQKAAKEGKLSPYQLIGLSKTYYEQLNPINQPLIGGANAQIAVQVVRGGISYNTEKKEKGTTQAQSDDA
jgi:predicted transcriptional regulator